MGAWSCRPTLKIIPKNMCEFFCFISKIYKGIIKSRYKNMVFNIELTTFIAIFPVLEHVAHLSLSWIR